MLVKGKKRYTRNADVYQFLNILVYTAGDYGNSWGEAVASRILADTGWFSTSPHLSATPTATLVAGVVLLAVVVGYHPAVVLPLVVALVVGLIGLPVPPVGDSVTVDVRIIPVGNTIPIDIPRSPTALSQNALFTRSDGGRCHFQCGSGGGDRCGVSRRRQRQEQQRPDGQVHEPAPHQVRQ